MNILHWLLGYKEPENIPPVPINHKYFVIMSAGWYKIEGKATAPIIELVACAPEQHIVEVSKSYFDSVSEGDGG